MTEHKEPADVADLLKATVAVATGRDDLEPRPGQEMLSAMIAEVMDLRPGHLVGKAPTGVGKSFGYLAPAVYDSVVNGRRTVVSTESKALQSQLVNKDFPTVAAAAEKLYGHRPMVAIHKGWSNYVCAHQAMKTGLRLTGVHRRGIADDDPEDVRSQVAASAQSDPQSTVKIGRQNFTRAEMAPLVDWALSPDRTLDGDRDAYPGVVPERGWEQVSISSSDCVGRRCPLYEYCAPRAARALTSKADVVVTNHAMLGVQAARNIPVVTGNQGIGIIDNIIIDEAHALPDIIRSQGEVEIRESAVRGMAAQFAELMSRSEHKITLDAWAQKLADQADQVATYLGKIISQLLVQTPSGEQLRLDGDDDTEPRELPELSAVEEVVSQMQSGLSSCSPIRHPNYDELVVSQARRKMSAFAQSVQQIMAFSPGIARWAQRKEIVFAGRPTQVSELALAPVDVGTMARNRLWFRPSDGEEVSEVPCDRDDELGVDPIVEAIAEQRAVGEPDEGASEGERVPLTVVAVSATLPVGYSYEMRLKSKIEKFPSPFTEAMGKSALFIPSVSQHDLDRIGRRRGRKWQLNTKEHTPWVAETIRALVEANNGSALVLSATSAGGKYYAQMLRECNADWPVLSYWDGLGTSSLVSRWKEEEPSVLVGTKGLMTGVDAPGKTNTLVILDRVPRAPRSPLGQARVEVLVDEGRDYWEADRMVYAADAAVMMEQAVGRLIRSVSDTGMVAVLDPRLLPKSLMAYPASTRKLYTSFLAPYKTRFQELDDACDWLRSSR